MDCETGKGGPALQGKIPGNIEAIRPFQVIAMNHILSLPKSQKGNTELLIWVDLFTGYVMTKASASRTAQTVAEGYEECISVMIDNRYLCRIYLLTSDQWYGRENGPDSDQDYQVVCS